MNVVWKLVLLRVLTRCCRSECDQNLGDDTSLIHTRGGAWSKLGGGGGGLKLDQTGDMVSLIHLYSKITSTE